MSRSFDPTTPIYLQIAEEIRAQILSGALSEGDRLTSTTEYATQYRINPATANKAIALLVDEGLVVKHRGIGMFVVDGALAALRRERASTYAATTLAPALEAGRLLGMSDDELLAAVADLLSSSPAVGPAPAPTSPDPDRKKPA